MGSVGNPNTLAPYGNYRGCSDGICSIYCPQWCYIIFPPPPGPFVNDGSDLNSSRPLMIIAVIGVLASILLLMVIVYIIISKCCSSPGTRELVDQVVLDDQVNHEMASSSSGLDEVSIKSIKVIKYKKGDIRDCCCSVCLSEFEEGDSLRLLPKCNHAFHLPCIDTWFVSHSNCPLCRADIVITTTSNDVNLAALEYCHRASTNATIVIVIQNSVDTSVSLEQSSSCYQ